MERVERSAALPDAMQGRWVDADDPSSELIVEGGEVIYSGQPVSYDYKLIGAEDGALTVSLRINDASGEDAFQKASVTELAITPEGEFHAYNVRFASEFIRA